MLRETYQTSPAEIDLISHGIPDVGFVDPTYFKDQFGVEGRVMLLAFGLFLPNKGTVQRAATDSNGVPQRCSYRPGCHPSSRTVVASTQGDDSSFFVSSRSCSFYIFVPLFQGNRSFGTASPRFLRQGGLISSDHTPLPRGTNLWPKVRAEKFPPKFNPR